jgi:single-strand DNA-binding protein
MFQRVTLIGRVGRDPEMRYTQDGTPVTNFSMVTSRLINKERNPDCPTGWKESYNGKYWELATWWRVTAWRFLAETVNQYVTKGMTVFVEGEVSGETVDGNVNPQVWTGNDGVARARFEITARDVKFMSRAGEGTGGPPMGEPPPEGYEEDALPF